MALLFATRAASFLSLQAPGSCRHHYQLVSYSSGSCTTQAGRPFFCVCKSQDPEALVWQESTSQSRKWPKICCWEKRSLRIPKNKVLKEIKASGTRKPQHCSILHAASEGSCAFYWLEVIIAAQRHRNIMIKPGWRKLLGSNCTVCLPRAFQR